MFVTELVKMTPKIVDMVKTEVKLSIRIGKKGDQSDFDCDMVVGDRAADWSISETADLL